MSRSPLVSAASPRHKTLASCSNNNDKKKKIVIKCNDNKNHNTNANNNSVNTGHDRQGVTPRSAGRSFAVVAVHYHIMCYTIRYIMLHIITLNVIICYIIVCCILLYHVLYYVIAYIILRIMFHVVICCGPMPVGAEPAPENDGGPRPPGPSEAYTGLISNWVHF